jgi:hypothetical protein
VAQVARAAEELVSEVLDGPAAIYISVEQPGVDSAFDSVDAFSGGLPDDDLGRVSRIFILASSQTIGDPRVTVDMTRSRIRTEARGPNPTWVKGAAERMREALQRHSIGPSNNVEKALWIVSLLLVIGLNLAVYFTSDEIRELPLAVRIGISVLLVASFVVAWASFFFIRSIFPALVLVPSAGRSSPTRTWRWLRPLVAWAATILATAAATVLIDRLFA